MKKAGNSIRETSYIRKLLEQTRQRHAIKNSLGVRGQKDENGGNTKLRE